MVFLRRHLRACITAWALFQAASLVCLIPRDCCADHRHRAAAREETCAMHRQQAEARDICVLRGTCAGPMASLAVLLPQNGVPPDSFVMVAALRALPMAPAPGEQLVTRHAPPETPPPRG
jgi:hypothetical protein